jgi:hypothetical protein
VRTPIAQVKPVFKNTTDTSGQSVFTLPQEPYRLPQITTAFAAFQTKHSGPSDVAGREESGKQPFTEGLAVVEWHWHKGGHRVLDSYIVKEWQFAFFVQAGLHDTPGILMQDTDESNGGRCGLDRRVGESPGDQFQRPGVIGVGVDDKDGIHTPEGINLT